MLKNLEYIFIFPETFFDNNMHISFNTQANIYVE
jgi:hypothetical protein